MKEIYEYIALHQSRGEEMCRDCQMWWDSFTPGEQAQALSIGKKIIADKKKAEEQLSARFSSRYMKRYGK